MYSRLFCALMLIAAGAAQAQQAPDVSSDSHVQPLRRCDTCDPGGGGGGGTTQPKLTVTSFSVSSTGSTVQLRASNGTSLSMNMAAGTATVSNGSQAATVPLSQALLQASNGDANQAAALQARFQALVNNPKKTSLLIKNGQVVPSTARVGTDVVMNSRSGVRPNLYPGPGGDGFGCSEEWSCRDVIDSDFSASWGNYNFDFWDSNGAGGSTATPDYTTWNSYRQEHCDHKTSDVTQIVGGSALTFAACATVETGVGALACAGAYVVAADALANYSEDNATCNSSYPGPGKWP